MADVFLDSASVKNSYFQKISISSVHIIQTSSAGASVVRFDMFDNDIYFSNCNVSSIKNEGYLPFVRSQGAFVS